MDESCANHREGGLSRPERRGVLSWALLKEAKAKAEAKEEISEARAGVVHRSFSEDVFWALKEAEAADFAMASSAEEG